jgi:hypothetical protein
MEGQSPVKLILLTPLPHPATVGSTCRHVLYVEMVNKTQIHILVIGAYHQAKVKIPHLGALGTCSNVFS